MIRLMSVYDSMTLPFIKIEGGHIDVCSYIYHMNPHLLSTLLETHFRSRVFESPWLDPNSPTLGYWPMTRNFRKVLKFRCIRLSAQNQ